VLVCLSRIYVWGGVIFSWDGRPCTLGKLFVQILNRFGKKPDDWHLERLLKRPDMFVRHLCPTGLDVGQHVPRNIIFLALQSRRQNLL
jgi:hypothetical protein